MASKKMRMDGSLSKKRQQYLEQLEREWQAEQHQPNLPGPSGVTAGQEPNLIMNVDESNAGAELCASDGDGGYGDMEREAEFDLQEENDWQEDEEDVYMERDTNYQFFDNISLQEGLRYVAVTKNLSRSTVNMILGLLRRKLKLCLPADARTLLKTSTKVGMEIQPILGGQFWYQGIETVIREHFGEIIPHVDLFSLQVFIDGLPLYKSSARQLWPILFKVEELPDAPVMLAGVFCGFTKPDHVEGFLRPLVDEVNKLQSSGLRFGDKTVGVKLHIFIADLPARCFAKATISYVGKHSCHKCTCVGVHEGKKVIFDDVDAALRTEESFKGRTDKEHHKSWKSPLEDVLQFIKNTGQNKIYNAS
uniref:uncharacterized protein LOC120952276 isoform X2 n=1 Tax=Anopheles coluzzii TaxID=1518534 RepID=UPI0020FFA76D|nr:uncharacterized protein LOC120952276 isoform X2 [Anopheles coluzzii]